MTPKSSDKVIFSDHPIVYPIERYEQVRDAYVESVAHLPGVVSIYQMGGTSAPGISDLDLIAVMEGHTPPPPERALSTHLLDRPSQYIFMHPGAMVTTAAVFKRMPILTYAANLTHLYGRTITTDSSDAGQTHIALAHLIDQGTHLMHRLTKFSLSGVVYIRRLIMSLSSIDHTLSLVRLAGIEVNAAWSAFVQEIQHLKRSWFESPDLPLLMRLLERGINVVMQVLFAVEHHMIDESILRNNGPADDVVFYQSPNAFTLFTNKAEAVHDHGALLGKRGLAIKYKHHYLNMTLSIVAAPRLFALQAQAYTGGKSVLAARLRNMIKGPIAGEIECADYEALLRRRVDLWSDNLSYLAKYGLLNFDVMPFPGARRAFSDRRGLSAAVVAVRDRAVLTYNRHVLHRSVLPTLRTMEGKT